VSVFAFEVSVAGTDWRRVINARTSGQAKYLYHLDILDPYPDLPFTSLRCRKVGRPESSRDFIRNAEYRGLPKARCGDPVRVGSATGVIVGHNASANFDVLFDDDSPKYAGLRLAVHPDELEAAR
jgi:hypothetical protein